MEILHPHPRIRPASLADLPFVWHLADRVFRIYGPYGLILGWIFLQGRAETHLALLGGRRAGFVMLSSVLQGLEVTALAVRPSLQGRGVGRALLREGISCARLRGAPCLWIHTAEDNHRAQILFLKEGFQFRRRILGYYPEGQTALEFVLPL